jgi:hypothetical protein
MSGGGTVKRFGAAALLACFAAACSPRSIEVGAASPEAERPRIEPHSGYVGSDACRACHPREFETWRASYHRTMTQIATPESLAGPVETSERSHAGRRYRLVRDGDAIVAETLPERGDVPLRRERVLLSTGSHHFQTYWIPDAPGRKLRLFELAYQIEDRRWLPMDALPLAPPGVVQSSEEDGGRWNKTCNRCHATAPEPRLFGEPPFDTRVAELGIACEACHGPGGEHVAANRDPGRRYAMHLAPRVDPTIVDPRDLPARRSAQVCGQCHSLFDFATARARAEWSERGFQFHPGDDLHANRLVFDQHTAPPMFRQTMFWADGQLRVNGREYNSLLASPCIASEQLACTSCHRLHPDASDPRPLADWADDQLHPGMRGNAACTQCHPQFAGAAALAAHTHHRADSPGSHCLDCHMPNTVWGLHKATRVHQVTSPSVQETLRSGRPNACNLCHLDRPLAWTARALERDYGIPAPQLGPAQQSVAGAALWALSGEAGQRALIAWHLGFAPAIAASGPAWVPLYLAELLRDPYPAVRSAALRSLSRFEGYADLALDPYAPASALEAQRDAVRARWRSAEATHRIPARPPLLIGAGGVPNDELIDQLLRQRDLRPIYLAE